MKIRIIILLIIFYSTAIHAGTIYLKGGHSFKAKIISETTEAVTVEMNMGEKYGILTSEYKKENIKFIERDEREKKLAEDALKSATTLKEPPPKKITKAPRIPIVKTPDVKPKWKKKTMPRSGPPGRIPRRIVREDPMPRRVRDHEPAPDISKRRGAKNKGAVYVTKWNCVAAVDENAFREMAKATAINDVQVLRSLLTKSKVFLIKEGIECHAENQNINGGIELRAIGTPESTFWTFKHKVRKK